MEHTSPNNKGAKVMPQKRQNLLVAGSVTEFLTTAGETGKCAREETPTLLGPLGTADLNHWTLSKGQNRVDVSSSPEDGKRFCFRNVVFSYA
jgi:hypothetical protein